MPQTTDESAEASKAITALSFEEALDELDALIGRLEGGQIALADAVATYERGSALASHCRTLLDRTEATISQLVTGAAGSAEVPVTGAVPAPAMARARAAQSDSRVEDGDDEIPF